MSMSMGQPAQRNAAWSPVTSGRKTAGLILHQTRYDLLTFWRNGQSRFFTVLLPVLFLIIFSSVFGHDTVKVPGGEIKESVYYVPGIIALGIISAAFGNLVISVTTARETGIYKRRRATPVGASVLIAARALTAVVTALAMTAVLLIIGWTVYSANIPGRTAPALVITVMIGTLAFCCLGFAVASLIRDADAAQPLSQAILLPLYFISGVFVPTSVIPHWLSTIAGIFPVRHLAGALLSAYNPHTTGTGIAWRDLGVVVAWGIAGLIVAIRRFSWLPRGA
jgi:ABC-2 type transport system permease protein